MASSADNFERGAIQLFSEPLSRNIDVNFLVLISEIAITSCSRKNSSNVLLDLQLLGLAQCLLITSPEA